MTIDGKLLEVRGELGEVDLVDEGLDVDGLQVGGQARPRRVAAAGDEKIADRRKKEEGRAESVGGLTAEYTYNFCSRTPMRAAALGVQEVSAYSSTIAA